MNRARRRQLDKLGIRYVSAVAGCEDCGAPICPDCNQHGHVCECCGFYNCDTCGHYLVGPRPVRGAGRGAAGPGVSREASPGSAELGLDDELLRRVQNETDD